ncbi:hypothetical protein ABZU75_11805 [Streptosporangium sp. NPDC005286]|uniref:hypothetical protein n=1 Tax=Streptosporangium sp. NPDC005286 TaxID=3154463 RepID=UPI0033BA3CA3
MWSPRRRGWLAVDPYPFGAGAGAATHGCPELETKTNPREIQTVEAMIIRMNLGKSLLRIAAGMALTLPLVASTPASAASAEAAPYTRITINKIIAWRTLSNNGDVIFVKISGPGIIPPLGVTYRVWPAAGGSRFTASGRCDSFDGTPCPPGTRDESGTLTSTPYNPVFTAKGGVATINIRRDNEYASDDDVFIQSFRLNPLTQESRYTLRPNAGRTDTSDYQVDMTLTPSSSPF